MDKSFTEFFKTQINQSAKSGETGLLVLDGLATNTLSEGAASLIQKRKEAFQIAKSETSRDLGCYFAVDAVNKPLTIAPTRTEGQDPFTNNFVQHESNSLTPDGANVSIDAENIAVVKREEPAKPSTEAILRHIVRMIQVSRYNDFQLGKRRPGIHEADLTTKTLIKAFANIKGRIDESSESAAITWVKFVAHDNEGYFDYLFGPDSKEYEKIAPEIKINQGAEFEANSLPYVEDLLQMNTALQEVIDFCSKSEIQGIKDQTPRFTKMHEGLIVFTNKVLEQTKISTDNLQNALVKFLGVESWAKFQEKYPGLLAN